MENQRTLLTFALLAITAYLYIQWIDFSNPPSQPGQQSAVVDSVANNVPEAGPASAQIVSSGDAGIPTAPVDVQAAIPSAVELAPISDPSKLITVDTDLVKAVINITGGVIERLELKQEPVSIDKPDQGFALLKNNQDEVFTAEDGLFAGGGMTSANHQTNYTAEKNTYSLGSADRVSIPLRWTNEQGIEFVKTISFNRDSYIVDIDYQVSNETDTQWEGYLYAQFKRTQPEDTGGGFGRLPSYTGGAVYEEEEMYQKIDFKDMSKDNLNLDTNNGWVAMIQHYFVGAWIPHEGNKTFYTSAGRQANPQYRIGYKTKDAVVVAPGKVGRLGTRAFLGSKQQSRLKRIQDDLGVTGLALTVDFGWLTFIADPLFTVLNWIHNIVGNWGWSIILLTILIKAVFYPLSAASYKSMAGMKKLQPRMKTLKERYKDDKQKYQMEMMALYKTEKINPAGGCLPILVQIPVFIALYWALLESVELRQAPFALWWTDLSAPDPYYVLPVLMGASMWAMQKLNPAAMDEIQRKVMMIMPIALTFLFLSFPQGLVLYWVVNNILSMSQQWYINKKHAV
jgi:YidC/Oxa1 family membrane protein insertase